MKKLSEVTPQRMRWLIGRVAELAEDGEELVGLEVVSFEDPDERQTMELDELLVFYGLAPNLGPIAEWGLAVHKRHIRVDPKRFQTSIPGVFAIGDISTYPGKKNLILSGFHETVLAAFAIQKHLDPDVKQRLEYTTTSSLMHKRLGVSGAVEKNYYSPDAPR